MATVDILSWEKKKVGSVELSSSVFDVPVREDILHTVVKWQLASRRQGTHAAKTRGEVSGGGKKPFKQKGTGNARQGSSRSPLMPGGGITFGPKPRDYSYNLPKKVRVAGLKSALSFLNKEGRLVVVEDMQSETGKTRELGKRLLGFGVQKALLIDSKEDSLFKRAAKNLSDYKYMPVEGFNVFDALRYNYVVITKDSIKEIEKRCGVES